MVGPQTSISDAISEWVTQERDASLEAMPSGSGMDVDENHHRDTIRSLVHLLAVYGIYEVVFEASYADITREYYKKENRQLYNESKAVDWIRHCSARLDQEERRLKDCCSEFPSHRIISIVQDRLMRNNVTDKFSQAAIEKLMNEKDEKGLSQMYNLYCRVQSVPELRESFKAYVKTVVQLEVHKTDNDANMIHSLISLKDFIDGVVKTCFVSRTRQADVGPLPLDSDDFIHAVRDAFTVAVGTRKNKPAELMAKHLDGILRQGQKGMSDCDFQKQVDEVMALHAFTPDRDVFRTFYMRALAKRVILRRSASDDFEKQLLAKLANSYDREFEKGQQMFNDLELSRNLQADFHALREHIGHSINDCDSFTMMVLQPSAWPTYKPSPLLLPAGMRAAMDHFNEFYMSKFRGRQLQWIHHLGTASLIGRFPKGEKELVLSLEQACVLLLFAEEDVMELTFWEIHEQINMDKEDLKRTLQSLALGKKRVFKKHPSSKDVNNNDVFSVNISFEDERRIVRVNNIQVKESAAENAQATESIAITRDLQLQAAIVRIMKAKKALTHSELVTTTVDAVKQHFYPDVAMIKAQISQLVDMEYLERDESDPSLYRYLA
ncbi:Cullin family-domain-containing protein [Cantharellus anzutake]|uniref:Cullin family-domain-containing protein n=1 Tax=Cantharellus anzutake TaxID=1750568 RepID=UPI001903CEA1|nr:Cullin family-domain-containing protein [Cantharellus anzutake]KAF8329112.1 Cullin family-domain-containing protein [Cantharellus anzutake]